MSKTIDVNKYIGNTYEDLTVLRVHKIPTKHGLRAGFIARCICGKEVEVLSYQLGKGKKSCGCRKEKPKLLKEELNLVGKVFSELTVLALHEESRVLKKGKTRQWICQCSCGKQTVAASSNLKSGDTKSCGHLKHIAYNKKPGEHRSKVYSAWKNAKYRCYNDDYLSSDNYKGRGIVMSDEFINDFEAFYNYIGDPPSKRHTLERIDVNGNYERGNLTWALPDKQARNKIKSKKNTSGVTGVTIKTENGFTSAVAFWREFSPEKQKMIVKNKSFSYNKYGEDLAFKLACEYREQMIQKLNEQGYGYSENHGK